jgi:hypothetical protein
MDQLLLYQNDDGTFTSPKNGKVYLSYRSFKSHFYYNHTSTSDITSRLYKVTCEYCNKEVTNSNIQRHIDGCYLNPINMILCKICNNPIKKYKTSKGTCSHACSNKHFRVGLTNGNYKGKRYRTICFAHHKKQCVVCGENKIVTVHHYDHDHTNDEPANLIPLCPTHHQYVHSRYKKHVLPIIEQYRQTFINNQNT